jgi:hypothetical protein
MLTFFRHHVVWLADLSVGLTSVALVVWIALLGYFVIHS